jgi:hypothetical protein
VGDEKVLHNREMKDLIPALEQMQLVVIQRALIHCLQETIKAGCHIRQSAHHQQQKHKPLWITPLTAETQTTLDNTTNSRNTYHSG